MAEPPLTTAPDCLWCRSRHGRALGPPCPGDEFFLWHCSECGLSSTWPRLEPTAMQAYYTAAYYGPSDRRFWGPLEGLVRWFRKRRAREIVGRLPPGRALDIGCGRGHTLAQLRAAGWIVEGVELNDAAAEHAREVYQLDVRTSPFDPTTYRSGQFNLIILSHVLEHLPDPRSTLEELPRLLAPQGTLWLSVPNFASWQARWFGRHGFHLDLPRHYSHFRADWLCARLRALGFSIERCRFASAEQNPFGWIQSLLNAAGLPYNLLYDLLRQPTARRIRSPWKTHRVAAVLSLLAGGLLIVPALLMLVPEAVFRRGATVEIEAVRGPTCPIHRHAEES